MRRRQEYPVVDLHFDLEHHMILQIGKKLSKAEAMLELDFDPKSNDVPLATQVCTLLTPSF